MAKRLDEPVGRGAFFKSMGQLMAGLMADKVAEAVTGMGPRLLRPPGALEEFDFVVACTRCDLCVKACPQESILKAGTSMGLAVNTPYVDPRAMPCFLCADLPCVKACPDGALVWPHLVNKDGETVEGPRAVRMGTAKIHEKRCLTYERDDRPAMACRTCVDRCPFPNVAIQMVDQEGSVPHPEVDPTTCTGCGMCVFACPTMEPAITVVPKQ